MARAAPSCAIGLVSSHSSVQDSKRYWRRELRRRLATLTGEMRRARSADICQSLRQLPEWTEARSVLLFYPKYPEPDVLPLWEVATEEGKTIAFPSFRTEAHCYTARTVGPWPPQATLPVGAFGIPEPPPTAPLADGNQLDFVVVPGVGFSSDGRRLGHGGGFYDRLLTDVKGFRCGVAYDEQLVDDLPAEPHDIRCDYILTPSRGWRCPHARM
jgi:5-formyltetrahydrofolate cyclo-ligase